MAHIEDCKRDTLELMRKVDGLIAVMITDREGVPLIKVVNEMCEQTMTGRPTFVAANFTAGVEQAGKLGIGQCHTIVTRYHNYQIVHFNKDKLIVALIANTNANIGELLALEDEFDLICQEFRHCVEYN
ncbi:ragulator complex protein LAMTOR3-A-like [Oppia nitens]|uniref:ragulator complex protein LAMTOR3-A-like n=1 Tax=Oppia nitens TaxID=1686743 RepID=UPI0023D9F3A0|nr:ragulator complex protein LAMTOR3-A-like [Oppia nitens]